MGLDNTIVDTILTNGFVQLRFSTIQSIIVSGKLTIRGSILERERESRYNITMSSGSASIMFLLHFSNSRKVIVLVHF